jgi:peptide subunit release factor 1 (eRF1)
MDLEALLDRLAAVAPTDRPFLSLYVDTRPDDTGRDHWMPIVRKELGERGRSFGERTPARTAYEADAERILRWLESETRASANGVAVFASEAAGVFEAVQLETPVERTELFVGDTPHLYPLARLLDRYRRYAVVVTDTHLARILVIALGTIQARGEVANEKVRRSMAGGWSQARFQRHAEKFQKEHMKEVVDALERIVREERLERVIVAGDEVALPLFREALPKALEPLVVEATGGLDLASSDAEILRETLEVERRAEQRDEAALVARAVDAYRAGGLGMLGLAGVRAALDNGQVHELILVADAERLEGADGAATADALVVKARQTAARVTFVEDAALLAEAGGVAALLRYRLHRRAA